MGATTSLSDSVLFVAPGGEARTTLHLRNTGTVVDQFDVEISAAVASWTTAAPPAISLLPGQEQAVEIAFRPPKSSNVVAGETAFAIRAASHEDPDGSSVAEGTITVESYDDRSAELIPRASRGRRSGAHEIAVDNRGNAPIVVDLSGVDPEGTARFDFSPAQLTVAPGTAQFSKLRVTPARMFWRGPNKTRPFVVFVTGVGGGEGEQPLPLDGSMIQVALLPKWFWKAALATLALVLLLAVAWFALVKPQIKTSAKEVVEPIDERLDAASIPELPTTAPGGGDEAGGGGDEGGGGGAPTTTTLPDPVTVPPATATTIPGGGLDGGPNSGSVYGAPYTFRLTVQSGSPSASYTAPAGQTFAWTDTIFQNPQGDSGRLTVSRNGDVLLELNLQNIRFNDEHTLSPIIFEPGDTLTLSLTCETAGPAASQCDSAATFFGFLQ